MNFHGDVELLPCPAVRTVAGNYVARMNCFNLIICIKVAQLLASKKDLEKLESAKSFTLTVTR